MSWIYFLLCRANPLITSQSRDVISVTDSSKNDSYLLQILLDALHQNQLGIVNRKWRSKCKCCLKVIHEDQRQQSNRLTTKMPYLDFTLLFTVYFSTIAFLFYIYINQWRPAFEHGVLFVVSYLIGD